MSLFINWFAVEGLPEEIPVQSMIFPTWEDTRETVVDIQSKKLYFHRRNLPEGCQVAIYKGNYGTWPSSNLPLATWPTLAGVIIERSLALDLQKRSFEVTSKPIEGVSAHLDTSNVKGDLLALKTGVRIKSYCLDGPFRPGVTINWHVAQEFAVSLSDERLAQIAIDQAAIKFRPHSFPLDSATDSSFLGKVQSFESDRQVIIRGRDGLPQVFETSSVTLEATSRLLKQFERQMAPSGRRNVFRQVQQLSYALDEGGGRNPNIFRDRMAAIRRFLASDLETETSFPALTNDSPWLRLHLKPTRIQ